MKALSYKLCVNIYFLISSIKGVKKQNENVDAVDTKARKEERKLRKESLERASDIANYYKQMKDEKNMLRSKKTKGGRQEPELKMPANQNEEYEEEGSSSQNNLDRMREDTFKVKNESKNYTLSKLGDLYSYNNDYVNKYSQDLEKSAINTPIVSSDSESEGERRTKKNLKHGNFTEFFEKPKNDNPAADFVERIKKNHAKKNQPTPSALTEDDVFNLKISKKDYDKLQPAHKGFYRFILDKTYKPEKEKYFVPKTFIELELEQMSNESLENKRDKYLFSEGNYPLHSCN